MHTTVIHTRCGDITVICNGDWSGTATIFFPGSRDPIQLPGSVLLAIGRAIGRREVVARVISFMEDLDLAIADEGAPDPERPAEQDPPRPDRLMCGSVDTPRVSTGGHTRPAK